MKAKTFLLIFMFIINMLNVAAQTKRPTRKATPPKKVSAQIPVKDEKIEFKMKIVDGGKLVIDSINNYYVIPFTGKTAHELYMDQLARIASIYVSPDRVTEKVEDKTIVINAAESNLMSYLGVTGRVEVIVKYRIEMQFKDGKIRLNPPSISKAIKNIKEAFRPGNTFEEINLNRLSSANNNIPEFSQNVEKYFNILFGMLVYGNSKQGEEW